MKKLITLLFVIISFSAFSQRTCATMDKLHERMAADPSLQSHHQEVMNHIQNPDNTQSLFRRPNTPAVVVTIPVVFHVLYKNNTQNMNLKTITFFILCN